MVIKSPVLGCHVWRERRVTGDEEREWSYSTAPGQYTLDVLREHFGETGYLHSPLLSGGSSRLQRSVDPGFQRASSSFILPSGISPDLGELPPGQASTAQARHRREGRPVRPAPTTSDGRRAATEDGRQQNAPAAGPWPTGFMWGPPPIPATFNGDPDGLAMFLGQILYHLDRYTSLYTSHWAMVVAIVFHPIARLTVP